MPLDETDIGGRDRAFRTTIWSDILGAGNSQDPRVHENLDRLFKLYWKPVYAYIRSSWKSSPEDSKDLTQAFFARFLEKDFLSRVTPEKGSFRGYLKRSIRNFLVNARDHEDVRKPAGRVFSLDATPGELERLAPARPDEPPETTYDREWLNCLLDASFGDLEAALKRDGKEIYFKIFKAYCLDAPGAGLAPDGGDSPTYLKLAADFNLQKHDVRNHIAACRKLLRKIVRDRVRDYVASDGDLEGELAEILKG